MEILERAKFLRHFYAIGKKNANTKRYIDQRQHICGLIIDSRMSKHEEYHGKRFCRINSSSMDLQSSKTMFMAVLESS